MFNPNRTVIDAFVSHTLNEFQRAFPEVSRAELRTLDTAAKTAMESLLSCDCPYHDIEHTMLVTDVGLTILHGRQLARGDLSALDCVQAVVAMLFHDIGYLRQLLRKDSPDTCIVDSQGTCVEPPAGATDAFMTPYHVNRSALFVAERFERDPVVDVATVTACIEMTRFPVPRQTAYQITDSLPGLVRAADLIGQMADPQYLQKLSRLFAEFIETGEAGRLGFVNAGGLRASFPDFFYNQVQPYISEGINLLKRTQEGQQWVANLYHHLHVTNADQAHHPRFRAPELLIDNAR